MWTGFCLTPLPTSAAQSKRRSQTLQADVSDQLLRTYIGRHLDELFQGLFPGCTRQDMDRMLAAYGTYWIITHVQLA